MSHRSPKRARVEAPPPNQNEAAHRIIIALDLDAFYVSASRIRDPSLVGLPIGIKQKGILATCSYEARALGVQKLATIKDSLRKCPDLILVNGEDLSYFRKLSNQVWRLVKDIVWRGRVEKLGLDELFCDVTEMIDAQDDSKSHRNGFFNLKKERREGFEYDQKSFAGHVMPDQPREFPQGDRQSRRLLVASHLAAYLRDQIEHQVGLTASAGVAHNKLIAKLVCAKHKPAQQTVFVPPQIDPLKATLQFLDPYEARALNGFGGVICNTLRNALGGESLGHSGTEWLNGGLGPDPQRHIQEHRGEDDGQPPPSLTVSLCRKAFSATQFVDLFGSRLGPRLWCLLHGRDDEPVVPAPEFPLQISVEDTYRNLRGGAVYEQMHILSENLIRRLEAELVDDDEAVSQARFELTKEPLALPGAMEAEGIRNAVNTESTTVRTYTQKSTPIPSNDSKSRHISRTWKRFPLSMRLSIRQGWDNRVSKQTRMPVELFELSKSRATRATSLTSTLISLYRSMIQQYGDKGQGLNLINIAALDLATQKPATALSAFFSSDRESASRSRRLSIDLDILRQLPEDLRKEVAAQHGLDLSMLELGVGKDNGDGDGAADIQTDTALICSACGAIQQPWLQHDHSMWPIHGVAPCFLTGSASESGSGAWTTRAGDRDSGEAADGEILISCSQQGH